MLFRSNAGKLLIEFILSEEGQTVLRNGNHVPASSKVDAKDPSLKRGFAVNYISPGDGVAQTGRGLAALKRYFPQMLEK